jgi:tRNA-splicing ligase RtcB
MITEEMGEVAYILPAGHEQVFEDNKGNEVRCTPNRDCLFWAKDPEQSALIQLVNMSNIPCLFRHPAAMPDMHWGYGVCIGGVICLDKCVSPNAVGKDIGCGMRFAWLDIDPKLLTKDAIIAIRRKIKKYIPTGEGNVHTASFARGNLVMHDGYHEWIRALAHEQGKQDGGVVNFPEWWKPQKTADWTLRSLGTLGGGNHFIEIQQDIDTGQPAVMIHSGSRNLGSQVATYHDKVARELCGRWFTPLPDADLAFLPVDTPEGQAYIRDMELALTFAKANRALMMVMCFKAIGEVLGIPMEDVLHGEQMDVHHNYAALENHFGHNVWVHRKGATSAKAMEKGIIPGSQGSYSYLVRGKGNIWSYMSCSHGAGRAHGRREACRVLNAEEQTAKMGDVVFDSWDTTTVKIDGELVEVADLEEAPGAYKDITQVMAQQEDLVEVTATLRPLGVVKGKKRQRKKR